LIVADDIVVVPVELFKMPAEVTRLMLTPETDKVPVVEVFAKTTAALSGDVKIPLVTVEVPDPE